MRPFPLFALLAAPAFAGCSESAKTDGSDAAALAVSGIVVDDAVRPLAGVRVTLDGNATNVTGADGEFLFPGVSAGAHTVLAELDGFLPKQASADAQPGAAPLRIVLSPIPAPAGYNQTYSFVGFIQAGTGLASSLLDRLPGGNPANGTGCTCEFTVTADGPVRAFVVEAVWEDNVPHPDGPTAYRWRIGAEEPPVTVSAYDPSPVKVEVNGGAFGPAVTRFVVGLDPDAAWPAAQQEFQMAVTLFYGQAPPPGFGV